MTNAMNSVTISTRDGRVVIFNPEARLALSFSWRAAVEIAHAIMYKVRGLEEPDSRKVAAARVRRDDDLIVLEQAFTGRLFAVWPLKVAYRIAEIVMGKARELETKERAEAIAYDQAILFRRGLAFGVTSDPVLQDEAGKLAAWDTSLRRYLPGGIRGREQFGAPRLVRDCVSFTSQELSILRTPVLARVRAELEKSHG